MTHIGLGHADFLGLVSQNEITNYMYCQCEQRRLLIKCLQSDLAAMCKRYKV